MYYKNCYFIIFYWLCCYCVPVQAQQKVTWEKAKLEKQALIEVSYFNIPGYLYNNNHEFSGVEYELLQEFKKFVKKRFQVNIRYEFEQMNSFKAVYQKALKGTSGDFFAASFSITHKRLKEVSFSPSYMADIIVMVSSLNLPIVRDSLEFVYKFKRAKGLAVKGTTIEKKVQSIKQKFLPELAIDMVEKPQDLWEYCSNNDNYFTFVQLDNYFYRSKKWYHLRRQNLFKTYGLGRGLILPKNSDWQEPLKAFFYDDATPVLIENLIKKYFGKDTQELLATVSESAEKLNKSEIVLLTKERDFHQNEVVKKESALTQKNILIGISILAIILCVVLIFLIYQRYTSQRKTSELIRSKNAAIAFQNEELKLQQEEIASQRDALKCSNDQLQISQRRISQSVKSAQVIQRALLPSAQKLNDFFKESFVLNLPKDIVSGDFYWIAQQDDKTVLVVADCTGHGIPGAFMTVIGHNMLDKVIVQQQETNPAVILEKLHQGVKHILRQDETRTVNGMDAVVVTITPTSEQQYQIVFAGAKNPLYYFDNRHQEVLKIKGSRKGIGGIQPPAIVFENYEITLYEDSILYLGSDGYEDQNSKCRKKLGAQRFLQLLQKSAPKPFLEQKQVLLHTLKEHMQGSEQRDDILWIGVKLGLPQT